MKQLLKDLELVAFVVVTLLFGALVVQAGIWIFS